MRSQRSVKTRALRTARDQASTGGRGAALDALSAWRRLGGGAGSGSARGRQRGSAGGRRVARAAAAGVAAACGAALRARQLGRWRGGRAEWRSRRPRRRLDNDRVAARPAEIVGTPGRRRDRLALGEHARRDRIGGGGARGAAAAPRSASFAAPVEAVSGTTGRPAAAPWAAAGLGAPRPDAPLGAARAPATRPGPRGWPSGARSRARHSGRACARRPW